MIEYLLYLGFYTGIVGISYISLYYPFLYLIDEFRQKTYNKRLYIIKNIIKSIILNILTFHIIIGFFNDRNIYYLPKTHDLYIDNHYIKRLASAYVSNDLLALLIVPKLPKTTKIHHITSCLILFYIYFIDFNDPNDIGKGIFLYTFMSMASYLVNFVLAVRNFNNFPYLNLLRKLAYYSYLACVTLNWGGHVFLYGFKTIEYTLTLKHIIYMCVLVPLINDDLVLLSWLKKSSNKKLTED
jgi:hypothetical protein